MEKLGFVNGRILNLRVVLLIQRYCCAVFDHEAKKISYHQRLVRSKIKIRGNHAFSEIIRQLTNRMWLSVVCTLIDNDIRHNSGQNVVDLRGAAE